MPKETDSAASRRTRLACVRCRERKKKCDGGKPICQSCLDNNYDHCKYLYSQDKRRPYTNNYVESLKKHIQNLESKLEMYENVPSTDNKTTRNVDQDRSKQCINQVNSINDLLDYSGKMKAHEGKSCRYYGPRSTVSFIMNDTPLVNTRPIIANCEAVQLFELGMNPHLENHLYNLYFAYQNCTLVFIWRDMFYQQLSLPESQRNPNFLTKGLQNAMLAIGSIFDTENDKETKFSIGNQYAMRARAILEEEMANPLISTVQTCGLLSIFYIYLNEDALALNFCSTGIGAAYSLGLNIGEKVVLNSQLFTAEEIELRRITFWAMFLLEITLSNMLGRPVFLKPASIISMVPSEIGVPDYVPWMNPLKESDTEGLKIYTRCFSLITYSIEMWIITSKPLDHIYLCFKPSIPSELEFIVNNANIELLQFENTFPEYLSFPSVISYQNRGTISPGIFVFQIRFQYIKILLNRVFFIRKFESPQLYKEEDIALHKKICYDSAMNIGKLTSLYSMAFGFQNFDFSTPEMVGTAAITLLFFIRYPQINLDGKSNEENDNQIKNASVHMFHYLSNSLMHISASNLWARRSRCVLEQLVSEWGVRDLLV